MPRMLFAEEVALLCRRWKLAATKSLPDHRPEVDSVPWRKLLFH